MLIVSHLNADTANFAIRNQKITKVVYLALARNPKALARAES